MNHEHTLNCSIPGRCKEIDELRARTSVVMKPGAKARLFDECHSGSNIYFVPSKTNKFGRLIRVRILSDMKL